MRCGLYDGAEAFPKAGQESRGVIAKIKAGQATCVFTGLKPGTYAIAAFHAENNETQMQYGLFGKPKEGYRILPQSVVEHGSADLCGGRLRICGRRPDDPDQVKS